MKRSIVAAVAVSVCLAVAPRLIALPNGAFQFLEPSFGSATPTEPLAGKVPSIATGGAFLADQSALLGQGFLAEVEPNGTAATATPLGGSNVVVRGTVFPAADVDVYSFTAAVGDRVYAATQTLSDASASGDSVLEVLDVDGTTVLELDNNDGTFNASSASIAGRLIPAAGTYYLRVRHNVATGTVRPYHLHFTLQSGAPVAEVEPNNTPATATPLPVSGWVSGTVTAISPGESDFYSITLAAGDSVFLSLDMNPERDAAVWNGRLGFALFGNPPANQILLANDANAGAAPADPNSEAFFFTVKDAGTYFVYVDSIVAAGLGANATYHLSVAVRPHVDPTASCTTYTSTDVPQVIPTGPGMVSSTLTVPGNPRIADLDVSINLNHTFMQDLDVQLVSPAGNDNGLFTDIGAATVGGAQTLMDIRLDDEAALPPAFALSASMWLQPELAYRLHWFDGEDAGGTWTLVLRDDATGDGGTLNSWSITICEPPPPPTCAPGQVLETVYSSNFEADDGGFTHSGVQDEWERGLPTFVPLTTCNSGVNCWVTDLDNTYNASSSQDLLSPAIDLSNHVAPVTASWAQRYHIESATFDHYSVDFREAGGANPTRVFEWLDATMNNTVGSGPAVTIAESAGWGIFQRDVSAYAGLSTEINFHLDGDTTVQLAGVAIDDVTVTACRVLAADLSITKTDGVATAIPGGSVTYTITASNAGPDGVVGATVADTFPAVLTCTWSCVGAGGGTCTAAGAGNINDAVNLPAAGSVTYTANCSIDAGATGSLANTATVSSAVADPTPANNSATDTDTLTPQADVAINKTDGAASSIPGTPVVYTIVASNPGPSNAPSVTIADTFPASLTGCSTTCAGAGGGTCTAGPTAGNINDVANLPAGGSVTYTSTCDINSTATGSLSNTATATVGGGVTDPAPGNNSATDTNTLTPQADLAITKTDGLAMASPGQAITYTIVVSNPGPSAAPAATVSDTFPAAFTGATWTCVGAGGGTCTAGPVAGNIADPVNLPAGASVTYTVNGTIDGGFAGNLANTASVAAGSVTDPNGANNSATDNTDVVGDANVSGTKTVSGDFSVGGTIFYAIVLTNSGLGVQGDNPGDEFTDTLPAELTLVGATASSGTAATAGNTATWNGSIPANGGTVTITIEATINAGTEGQSIVNQGTINFDSDGDNTNESSTTTDDPDVAGSADPTTFDVALGQVNPLEIPTSSPFGLILLALVLASLAAVRLRRRET